MRLMLIFFLCITSFCFQVHCSKHQEFEVFSNDCKQKIWLDLEDEQVYIDQFQTPERFEKLHDLIKRYHLKKKFYPHLTLNEVVKNLNSRIQLLFEISTCIHNSNQSNMNLDDMNILKKIDLLSENKIQYLTELNEIIKLQSNKQLSLTPSNIFFASLNNLEEQLCNLDPAHRLWSRKFVKKYTTMGEVLYFLLMLEGAPIDALSVDPRRCLDLSDFAVSLKSNRAYCKNFIDSRSGGIPDGTYSYVHADDERLYIYIDSHEHRHDDEQPAVFNLQKFMNAIPFYFHQNSEHKNQFDFSDLQINHAALAGGKSVFSAGHLTFKANVIESYNNITSMYGVTIHQLYRSFHNLLKKTPQLFAASIVIQTSQSPNSHRRIANAKSIQHNPVVH